MTSSSDGLGILPQPGDGAPTTEGASQVGTVVQRRLGQQRGDLERSRAVVDGLDGSADEFAEAARMARAPEAPLSRALRIVQARGAQPASRTAALERIARKSPTLARWLSDPARMGAATDDAEALERLDASLRKLRNTTTNRELAESISSAVLAGPRGVSSEIAGGFYDKMAGYMGALAAGVGDYALMQVHNAVRTAKEGQTDPSLRPGYIIANLGPDQYGPEADRSRSILRRAFREAAAGQVTHYSQLAAEQRAQRTAAANRYFQGIEDAEGLAVVRHMLSSTRGLSLLVAQNLSFALDPLVGGAAGFAAGGVPGAAVGAFGGGVTAEYGPWINGRLSEMGYDLTDPDQVQAAYTNRPLMAQLRDEALKKGVATAVIDAAFQVITGGVSRALRGPGYALAAVRGTAALGSETLGEFGSELGGKYSATGEVDLKEALIEAVASLGQSAGQAGLGGAFSGVSRGTAPARERVARAAQAHIDARTLQDAIAGWRASHVARRLPEALRELVTQHVALGDGSESAAQAFIDLETWDDHASAAEADPIELLDAFVPGEGADRYGQAEKTGQVVIPLERYIEGVAGDTAHDPLVELTRFREAGVTLAEADEALTVEDLPGLGEALTGEVAQAGESTRLFQESRSLEKRRAEVEKEIAALEGGEAAAVGGPAEKLSGEADQGASPDNSAAADITEGRFPIAADVVSGLRVRPDVPNMDSIGSTFADGEVRVLDGVREVRMSDLGPEPAASGGELGSLASEIRDSGEINPLIVVFRDDGDPWILEGSHRIDALDELGVASIPAIVVLQGDAPTAYTQPDTDSGGTSGSLGEPQGSPDPAAASQRLAALQAERAEIDTRLERIQQTEELAANLEDRLTADLVAAGEKSERAARLQVMPLVQGYRTLAERSGKTLADLLDRFQTRVGVAGLTGSATLDQTAFHGGPHRFDRFSLDAIGTGEGVQAYGWGLYFAEAEGVARMYRENLSGKELVYADGTSLRERIVAGLGDIADDRPFGAFTVAERALMLATEAIDDGGSAKSAAVFARREAVNTRADARSFDPRGVKVPAFEAIAATLESLPDETPTRDNGALYTVDLAPAEDEYLLWDVPLSGQSEKVQDAVEGLGLIMESDGWLSASARLLDEVRSVQRRMVTDDGSQMKAEVAEVDGQWVTFLGGVSMDSFGSQIEAMQSIDKMFPDRGATGERLYSRLMDQFDAPVNRGRVQRMASEALAAAGIPGIKYLDGNSRSKGEGSYNYVIFDENLINIVKMEQANRGAVSLGETTDGGRRFDIELLRTADRSTFLHETGHVFLEILGDLASDPDAAEQIRGDFATVVEWLGVESVDAWRSMPLEQRREAHEKFARGVEGYLRDGKAPSTALRRAFAAFRQWLVDLYRQVRDLNVELSDDIRGVLDRLLATDEEIAAVQYEVGPAKLPEAYLEGLSDEERARIAAKEAAAQDAAVEGLETDRRRLEAEAERDERSEAMETYRAQAAAEIDAAPATQALYLLRDGTLPDGSPLPEGVEPAKIARESVPSSLRADLKRLGVLADEGEVFDSVLAAYGATSGEDFVAKLRNAKNRERIVDQVARAMMAKDRGRAPSQREVRSAARRRSANQERSELLELKAREAARRARAAERRADAADESDADRRAAYDAIPKLAQLRAQVKAALATVPEIDLQPHLYASTAARMGRLSDDRARAGDWSMAAQYAERERYNHELHRVANQMRRRAEQNRKALLKFTDGKKQEILGKAGWSYQDTVNGVLARFNLRPMGRNKIEALKSLAEWLTSNAEQREAAGDTRPIEVSEKLKDEAFRKPWRELTLGEMEQVRESVEAIYHLAATKHRMFTAQKDRQFAEVRDDVLAQLEASKAEMPRPAGAKSRREQFFDSQVANYLAAHKKVPLWARLVDENEDGGPLVRAIVRPANDAATAKAARKAAEGKRLDAVFGILHDWGTSEFRTRHDVPGFSRGQLTHEDRLAAALHWGNETGRERLIGHATKRGWVSSPLGWSEADMQAVLATLTEEDVRFLNELYAYYDSFKPEIEARDRRTKGIAPEWVEPIAYETPGGKVTGGYHKLKYGDRAQEFEISEQAKLALQGVAASSNTRQGHLKTRVATVGEGTVRLDFGVTFEHIEETLHDLTHHEALLDINRVLRDRSVKAAIVQRHGTETYQMLKDWIQDIAAGPQGSVGRGFDFINYFRGNSTQAMLMFKVMTGVVNISGLFQSVNRIGARYVWEGFQRWTRSDKGILETVDWVREVSPFMAQRSENMHQVLFEMRDKLDGKHRPAVIAWQEAGWAIIAKTQTLVDMPTWLGAHQKAMDGGAVDSEAVAQADQAVRDSQGSGELVDLARIQRSRNQFLRLYTSFMFYTNTTWNLGGNVVESWRNTDPNHRRAAAMLSQLTTLYFAQALFAEVIKMALRGTDEDEPDEIALDLVGSVFGEMLNIGTGGLAGVREVSSVFSSFAPQGPAGTRLIPAAHRFYQQAAQGELDAPLFRSALDMAGGLLPNVPSAQLTTTWRAMERISEGEITGLRMLTAPIFGSPYRDR